MPSLLLACQLHQPIVFQQGGQITHAAEDVTHDLVRLVDKAEDADTREQRENPLREDLPAEDRREDSPEHARALRAEATVEVQRLEHVRRHDGRRPEGDGRVDERLLKQAGEGVADELGREQGEDRNARVDLVAVVQVLHGDDLDGGGGVSSGGRHNDNGDMLLDYTIINACCN